MLLVRAMREVQPGHIHAPKHQLADHVLRVARWTDRADNLGAPPEASVSPLEAVVWREDAGLLHRHRATAHTWARFGSPITGDCAPNRNRGYRTALNSAPTSTTIDTRYSQIKRAMAVPTEPYMTS